MTDCGGINNSFPNTITGAQSLTSQHAVRFQLASFVKDRCHAVTQYDVAQPKGLGYAKRNNVRFIVAEIVEIGGNTWQCVHFIALCHQCSGLPPIALRKACLTKNIAISSITARTTTTVNMGKNWRQLRK